MLDKIILQTKKARYLNQIQELKDKDIQAEVDARLATERARLEAEIRKDIEADINKCENYLELLDTLIEEADAESEEHAEAECIADEAIAEEPVELHSAESTQPTDVFQVR